MTALTHTPQDDGRPTRLTEAQLTELRDRARREAGSIVDPHVVHAPKHFHNHQWAAAIVGRPDVNVLGDWPTMYLLWIAMKAEPNPPVAPAHPAKDDEGTRPTHGLQDTPLRTATAVAEARAAKAAAWTRAIRTCLVKVQVRENTRARPRGGRRERLRHVVPDVEAVSATRRRHLPGRALCELPNRSKPLDLSDEPVDEPATCKSCLTYLSQIRPTGAPARRQRPSSHLTAAQRLLLDLIAEGKVVTIRHPRGGTDIRIPSQPSPAARCGMLGRKVTAQVRALEARGWAREGTSDTHGKRWELTDSGHQARTT